MTAPRTPGSTYRLQLHKGFTFDDASAIAQYLYDLGVTHVYSSPYLQAAPGSMHGYDVVDHQRVNAELGGPEAHARYCKRLGENGLGQVLDIVPNHMSLGKENRLWWDVLENGATSRYASFFDIDWQPQEERLRDKVLVPVLGDQYGRVLGDHGIVLAREDTTFLVKASEQSFPVAPNSLPVILYRAAEYVKGDSTDDKLDRARDTLTFLAASFGRLPRPESWDRFLMFARDRDKRVLYGLLRRLCEEEPAVNAAIDRTIKELNDDNDILDDFLNQQFYRLAYWKTADQQLGYRRFFDVNTLIGLRMEREHVFEETHSLLLDWIHKGVLDGVRVDHPDGLRDPLEYFDRLRDHAPEGWIIGEKILEPGEWLRKSWPIDGTSGYDFMNTALGLLVDAAGMRELQEVYSGFTHERREFKRIAHDSKLTVLEQALGSDVNRLTSLFVEICEDNRNQRDFTRAEIRRALRETAACFAIYRTYVVPDRGEITDEDRQVVERATRCANDNRSDIDASLFDFIRRVLTGEVYGRKESEFVLRFQQFTSPVMAKGVEDTAFYRYNRLVAMNEVGGDPGRDGLSVDEFHSYNAHMQEHSPRTMTTLSTHDTKRADDVRARLAVLSERPREFRRAIRSWSRLNARMRSGDLPDRNTEYFFYQTLIGAWPITVERMQQYMEKAMREAKHMTSWVANNKEYEDALRRFVAETMASEVFMAEVEHFVEELRVPGRVNSLAQTLLKYTSPGVPDLYQGGELWDHSLVDPDNRRPVDYDQRRRLLAEIQTLSVQQVQARSEEGLPKLWTIHRALKLRREHPAWFGAEAEYVALAAAGRRRGHVVAFRRGDHVVTVVPRLTAVLDGQWQDTTLTLPAGVWRNRLTDEVVHGGTRKVDELLRDFPVALLSREEQ